MEMWFDGFVESATPWAIGALVIIIALLFFGAMTDFGRGFRRSGPWTPEHGKSRLEKAVYRAFLKELKDAPMLPASGSLLSTVQAKNEKPVTADKVLRFDPDANKPHKVSIVVCLRCLHRWTAVRPVETRLVQMQCPGCHMDGGAIETGEDVTAQE